MDFLNWLRLIESSLNKDELGLYDDYKVFTVNEKSVRDKSEPDEEFTDYAVHEDFPDLIPQNEVWIAENLSGPDRQIAISTALHYLRYRKHGYGPNKAYDKSVKYESSLRERQKNSRKRPWKTDEEGPGDVYDKHYMLIRDPKGDIDVWLVHGDVVRDLFKTDFVEGGNGWAYPWQPNKEIWIEEDLKPSEIPAIVLHEYVEMRLMRDEGLSYNKAHEIASKVEFRHRQKDTEEMLLSPGRYINKEDLSNIASDDLFKWIVNTYVHKNNEFHGG